MMHTSTQGDGKCGDLVRGRRKGERKYRELRRLEKRRKSRGLIVSEKGGRGGKAKRELTSTENRLIEEKGRNASLSGCERIKEGEESSVKKEKKNKWTRDREQE